MFCHDGRLSDFEELKNSGKWEQLPFFIRTLMKMGDRMHIEGVKSIKELQKEAVKEENQIYFIKEEK